MFSQPIKLSLKILNINFQSIRNKIPLFHALLEKEQLEVIAGTETWLDDTVFSSEILPPSYQVFRRDRKTSIGGGVLLAIKHDLIAKEETNLVANCESSGQVSTSGEVKLFF